MPRKRRGKRLTKAPAPAALLGVTPAATLPEYADDATGSAAIAQARLDDSVEAEEQEGGNEPGAVDLERLLVERYSSRGPHPEYVSYSDSVRLQANSRTAFDFVRDAVEGRGGFETGDYLDPHIRETAGGPDSKIKSGTIGAVTPKFQIRRQIADYDNFVRPICGSYVGYIQQQQDEIKRVVAQQLAGGTPSFAVGALNGLQDLWADVDRRGTPMSAFLEAPAWQARQHGYAVVVVDRPIGAPDNAAEEEDPAFRCYAYTVASRNLVDWVLDDDGELVAAAILEPDDEDQAQYSPTSYSGTLRLGVPLCPVRVWTRWTWGVYEPAGGNGAYVQTSGGAHNLGEVPIVILYNNRPSERCLLGTSEMREVALLGKTKYNLDSEIRELQRNTCFPFLWVPMKNPDKVKELTISTQGATATDGTTAPAYVSPDTSALQSLRESAKEKVEAAYAMAHLAAVTGYVETSSGFHTQAEFDKTNRAISAFAANMEDAEKKIARLYLRYRGVPDENIVDGGLTEDGKEETPLFTVSYPRNFNIQDTETRVKRTKDLLALGLGERANTVFLTDLFAALYPRLPADAVQAMAAESAMGLVAAEQAKMDQEIALRTATAPDRRAGLRSRVKELAGRAGQKAAQGAPPTDARAGRKAATN